VSLRRKLVAAVLCLAGAGAGVITLAGVAELRGYLTRQADQQLAAEAAGLAHHAEAAWPGQGAMPGDRGGDYVEVFAAGGQPLLPQNQRPGPAITASPAWVRAHAGQPVTVPGRDGGQSWRIIAVPVHYQAHHIMYVYGADDVSLVLTSRAQPGLPATLVVGTGLAGIGQAGGKLAVTGLAFGIVMILAAAGIGAAAIRIGLRPLAGIQATADAAAGAKPPAVAVPQPRESDAGEPLGADGPELTGGFGGLARSVTTILSRAGEASRAQAAAESAARHATEQMRRALVGALLELREPLSVIAGFAEYHRQRGGEPGATIRRLEDETARMGGTVDRLSAMAQPVGAEPPQASAELPEAGGAA
jgi:two-component system, OmpR family, sensor kinase